MYIAKQKFLINKFNININVPLQNVLYLIFTEANKDCKDTYNVLISRKKEAIKAAHKRNGDKLRIYE